MANRTLSLTLLVPGVVADDSHDAAAADNLALIANSFDAGSNFHRYHPLTHDNPQAKLGPKVALMGNG